MIDDEDCLKFQQRKYHSNENSESNSNEALDSEDIPSETESFTGIGVPKESFTPRN